MKQLRRNAWLLLILLTVAACNKREAFTPVDPPVTGGDGTPEQYGTPFNNVPDRRDGVIYQVNIRPFSAAGNLAGVTARLDFIKALGVNIIYLMPVYPIGAVNSINSPYSVKDYIAVNPELGTLNDLRALVDGAHARNMSILLDFVANHTAWDHPWINAHKDWYVQNASGTIVSPAGYNDVAQLNFNNTAMRLQMIRNMKYWVYAANVDGYRFDFADNIPADFWKQAVDTLRNITTHKLLLMAEGSRPANFTAGLDYNFGFSFYGNLKSIFSSNQPVTTVDALNTTEYQGATNGQQVVRYVTNHDVNSSDGTPLELFGGQKGSMAAFLSAAYMKGVPMIYNGQEVGTPIRLTFPFTTTKIDWSINPQVTEEYKKVIAFRNQSNAIRRGELTSYSSADVLAFVKQLGAEKVVVIANWRNSNKSYALPAALANTSWKDAFSGEDITLGTSVSLAPYAYLVYKTP